MNLKLKSDSKENDIEDYAKLRRNKENYVQYVVSRDFDYFITFTFNREFAEDDCLQQIDFIISELNRYYFGRNNPVGCLDKIYVDEKQTIRGGDHKDVHILVKDNPKFHDSSKKPLKEKIEQLITRVCSQRSRKVFKDAVYNRNTNKYQKFRWKQSMGSIKHFNFQTTSELPDKIKVANYVLKSFEKDLNSDFIHF